MHSAIERMTMAANRLPKELHEIYRAIFHDDKAPEEICKEKQISFAEFETRKKKMLRSLIAAAS